MKFLIILAGFFFYHLLAVAQDSIKKITVEEMNKKRQNPVSGLKSVFLQDVIIPFGEGNANSFSIQPVWPFRLGNTWKLITYTIIPFQTIPPVVHGGTKASGLGNIVFNGFFRKQEQTKKSFSWSIGPTAQLPTRTDPALGSNTLSMGPALLLYYGTVKYSGGIVAQNLWSLGGTGINKVNFFSGQYIFYYNFPKQWYFESNATVTANWLANETKDIWTVPVGGGMGKTFQIGKGKYFYSGTLQGFYNATRPEYVGTWMVIAQLQVIFSM